MNVKVGADLQKEENSQENKEKFMKTILVYCWQSVSEPSAIEAIHLAGYRTVIIDEKMKDYHADAAFAEKCMQLIHAEGAEAIFSFDYFPLLSMIAHVIKIPYLSWVYDCPMYTLLSKTIQNPENCIFCFDEKYSMELQARGAAHVCCFPLGTDCNGFEKIINPAEANKKEKYQCDISFVGNFYQGDKNLYRKMEVSTYTKGFAEGIIEAQKKVYGYNFIKEALNKTMVQSAVKAEARAAAKENDVVGEIVTSCQLTLGAMYECSDITLAADVLGMEVSAREREEVTELLAKTHTIHVYTGDELPWKLQGNSRIVNKGKADYRAEMPLVFHESKINLNITSKTIETGIPQRVLDILACGGFCLTNYQPEIVQYFEDGKELAVYGSMEEMQEKADYYLRHEEERKQIALAGQRKVKELFDVRLRMKKLLQAGMEQAVRGQGI